MTIVELGKWELTVEARERFSDWVTGKSHQDFVDVRNSQVHFTPLRKPVAESTVALVSTGGIRLRSQRPFDLLKPDGDWTFRPIPSDTSGLDLTIDHSHYNHGDADDDVNCMFPIDRLQQLVQQSHIRAVTKTFFGMMGFIPNGTHVVEEAGPEIARHLKAEGADVVLLTPT